VENLAEDRGADARQHACPSFIVGEQMFDAVTLDTQGYSGFRAKLTDVKRRIW